MKSGSKSHQVNVYGTWADRMAKWTCPGRVVAGSRISRTQTDLRQIGHASLLHYLGVQLQRSASAPVAAARCVRLVHGAA